MLQPGELVRIATHLGEQSLDNRGLNGPAYRRSDRFLQLVAAQPRDKVKAFAHSLRQIRELRALPQIIRPHYQQHVDRQLWLGGRIEKPPGQGLAMFGCFRATAPDEFFALVPEYLFELVGDDEHIDSRVE